MGPEDFGFYDQSYYDQLAEQERNKYWNMAKAYFQKPTFYNILNGIGAAWNSLPMNTNRYSVNPNASIGIINDLGVGPSRTLSMFEKLSAAGKVQNAKSLAVRRAKAEARKAAERQAAQARLNTQTDRVLKVRNTTGNYVENEAERAAAIDFLRDNPDMRGNINTDVFNKYSDDYYMYPWNPQFNKLLPNRKPLKQVRLDLDKTLRNIR